LGKKGKITEGGETGRASKTKPGLARSSRSGSATDIDVIFGKLNFRRFIKIHPRNEKSGKQYVFAQSEYFALILISCIRGYGHGSVTVIIGKTRDGPETAETHMRSDGRVKSVRTPRTVVQPIRQSVTTPSLFIVKSVATC